VSVGLVSLLVFGFFAVMAALIRHAVIVVLPLVGVPLFYAGLESEWWGAGVGDGWQYVAVLFTLVAFLGSLVGLAVGGFLHRLLHHRDRKVIHG
jgi:hypothetical protein